MDLVPFLAGWGVRMDLVSVFSREPVVQDLRAHKGVVNCVAWNTDGRRLASASADHSIRIWSPSSEKGNLECTNELRGHTKSIEKVSWSPVDSSVLASLSADKTIKFWDLRMGVHARMSLNWPGFAGINLAWSPCGRFLAVGGKDDTLKIICVESGECEASRRLPVEVNQMAWGSRGDRLFLTTGLGPIDIVSTEQLGNVISRLPCHTSNAFCMSRPPGSELFAVGAADALVSVWKETVEEDDANQLAVCVGTMGRLEWPVRAVALHPSGVLLAAGGEDTVVDVIHVQEGRRLAAVKVKAPVTSLAWHPTDRTLVVATEEKDTRNGRAIGNFHLYSW